MKSWSYQRFTIYEFSELESTNNKAMDLVLSRQLFDGDVVLANKQTGGKGRDGRQWISPEGNLYFSLILTSSTAVEKIPQISFIAAISLRDSLEKLSSKIELKWPNDVLLNGKKLAGILLENDSRNVILGVGVNVDSFPTDVIFPATSLKEQNLEISREELLKNFLNKFEINYQNWQNFGFSGIRNSWLRTPYNLGKVIEIRDGNIRQRVIFKDLDEEGNMVVDKDGEMKKLTMVDVFPV